MPGDDIAEVQRYRYVVQSNGVRSIVRALVRDPGGAGEFAEFEGADPTAAPQVPWEVLAGAAIEAEVAARADWIAAYNRRNDQMAMTTRFTVIVRDAGPPITFHEEQWVAIDDPQNPGTVVVRGPIT